MAAVDAVISVPDVGVVASAEDAVVLLAGGVVGGLVDVFEGVVGFAGGGVVTGEAIAKAGGVDGGSGVDGGGELVDKAAANAVNGF